MANQRAVFILRKEQHYNENSKFKIEIIGKIISGDFGLTIMSWEFVDSLKKYFDVLKVENLVCKLQIVTVAV